MTVPGKTGTGRWGDLEFTFLYETKDTHYGNVVWEDTGVTKVHLWVSAGDANAVLDAAEALPWGEGRPLHFELEHAQHGPVIVDAPHARPRAALPLDGRPRWEGQEWCQVTFDVRAPKDRKAPLATIAYPRKRKDVTA